MAAGIRRARKSEAHEDCNVLLDDHDGRLARRRWTGIRSASTRSRRRSGGRPGFASIKRRGPGGQVHMLGERPGTNVSQLHGQPWRQVRRSGRQTGDFFAGSIDATNQLQRRRARRSHARGLLCDLSRAAGAAHRQFPQRTQLRGRVLPETVRRVKSALLATVRGFDSSQPAAARYTAQDY